MDYTNHDKELPNENYSIRCQDPLPKDPLTVSAYSHCTSTSWYCTPLFLHKKLSLKKKTFFYPPAHQGALEPPVLIGRCFCFKNDHFCLVGSWQLAARKCHGRGFVCVLCIGHLHTCVCGKSWIENHTTWGENVVVCRKYRFTSITRQVWQCDIWCVMCHW